MARKPNYNFEKRRKEQARKERQEEKRTRKREGTAQPDDAPASDATRTTNLPSVGHDDSTL
jgi:hypothetical protein